jgi:hypothetical protein
MRFAELFRSFKTFKQFKSLKNAPRISELLESPEIILLTPDPSAC